MSTRTLQQALDQHGLSIVPHIDAPGRMNIVSNGISIAGGQVLTQVWDYIHKLEHILQSFEPTESTET